MVLHPRAGGVQRAHVELGWGRCWHHCTCLCTPCACCHAHHLYLPWAAACIAACSGALAHNAHSISMRIHSVQSAVCTPVTPHTPTVASTPHALPPLPHSLLHPGAAERGCGAAHPRRPATGHARSRVDQRAVCAPERDGGAGLRARSGARGGGAGCWCVLQNVGQARFLQPGGKYHPSLATHTHCPQLFPFGWAAPEGSRHSTIRG